MDEKLQHDLARYKRCRDAVLQAEEDTFVHHAHEFVRELRRNPLTKPALDKLPAFDVDAWLNPIIEQWKKTRDARLTLPDDDDERLIVLLDLTASMAEPDDGNKMSVDDYGRLLNIYKRDRATAAVIDSVVRPLCELLNTKLQQILAVAHPAVRELAGVPLGRIPAPNETLIFLSHKTADKPVVRPYYDLLKELGFSPWLDEESMKPGDTLHREITEGFDRACAVVFFITKHFVDEKWLKLEIDAAVQRKIERDKRFAVITLVFDDARVPRPLRNYIWVKIDNQVEAFRQVVRALPIEVGPTRWRE